MFCFQRQQQSLYFFNKIKNIFRVFYFSGFFFTDWNTAKILMNKFNQQLAWSHF